MKKLLLPVRQFKALIVLSAVLALSAFFGASCTKTTLQPGGFYAQTNSIPDKQFFLVDSAYDVAYATIDAAFKFERDNRLWLFRLSPEVKHTLDSIRPQAQKADQLYLAARKGYLEHPTPAGLTLLHEGLARTQQIMSAAQAAVARASQ